MTCSLQPQPAGKRLIDAGRPHSWREASSEAPNRRDAMELVRQPSLRDKLVHFDLMKRLTEDSDDSDDGHGLAARQQLDRQRCMRFFHHSHGGSAPTAARHHALVGEDGEDARTATCIIKATQPGLVRRRVREAYAGTADETVIPETRRVHKTTQQRPRGTPLSFALRLPNQVDGGAATGDSPSVGAQNKSRKRRRGSEGVKMRPEGEQIFRGLRFCYIPNDDVAPARRLRIGKAREFGAFWTREPLTATHVIVDKDISYGDVERMIGPGGPGNRVVVNEEYPVDCVRFRSLLDHRQKKYGLPGQTLVGEAVEEAGPDKVAAGVAERAGGCLDASTDSLQWKAKPSPPPPRRRSARIGSRLPEPSTTLGGGVGKGDGG
ncbi:hypothetical protein E4U53_007851 [Claviceps sorghi]|nr:hypothetical protein E4U53_007851 [Claviceps sorghi]